ncbi:MAG: hypothetical protein ACRD6X_19225, partial [Pyrinomonadaceae bacterium]
MNKLTRLSPYRFSAFIFAALMFALFLIASAPIYGQNESPLNRTDPRDDKDEQTKSFGEMVLKQQISRRKKEHDELLERGNEVLKLSQELEDSFSKTESFSQKDLEKLQTLEKAVEKIRKDLGGEGEDKDIEDSSSRENTARQSIGAAFKYLRESTVKLVEELKRTSRFSISAAAIQTSNSVI